MPDDDLPGLGARPLGAATARARRRRGLRIAAWTAAGLVLLGASGAGYMYFRLNDNIHRVNIDSALHQERRPARLDNGAMDILVLGSDSRSGADSVYGRDTGTARSDTAMVIHLNRGHTRATVVSIPRDTLVHRPPCTTPRGGTAPAADEVMFNSAYEVGGPACAVKTVESLSGLRMDHYVEVDFSGFRHLVDALGGVPLTTTAAIHDPDSHLDLPAGTHTLNGAQALGLVRTRHGVADGSDLGRIKLQQAFLRALLDRIGGLGLLTSPGKLFSVADTATSAVTTDTGLGSVNKLMNLAQSVQHIDSRHTHTVTLPVEYAPTDPNRVRPIASGATMVWAALRADRPVPPAAVRDSVAEKSPASKVVGRP
ncbi:LCP family protein [Actinacidiphila acididurans]|uniref:LCP family protein n=1 Tax=Actinacidiphila acididurans TaxID=2784346 RepID=A0ABS2TK18_9ACTN|nr:LCP family protein [Actinacidiphila acididurans]MBM9503687.1 LCP family protein [Actinacidiphila acididurans]